MDPIIKNYKIMSQDDDLIYCEMLAYQKNMDLSVDYGEKYYEKYLKMENTPIAKKLNELRTTITQKYCTCILDMGIGSGEFIKKSKLKVYGYDINPLAIKWLKENNLFIDPYNGIPNKIQGVTLWDVLEHIPDPQLLLTKIAKGTFIFLSLPVFTDLTRIKYNKHYRPNEHYYYFTIDGIKKYMKDYNFSLLEDNNLETLAGREDISTFVFIKN